MRRYRVGPHYDYQRFTRAIVANALPKRLA
jgi:hypothetical protein